MAEQRTLEAERAAFEREHCGNNRDVARKNEHRDYVLPSIQDAWSGGKAARRAAPPALGEDGLPPLAEPYSPAHESEGCHWPDLFTAEQVSQAQREAVASLRASYDAAVELAGETIDARNAEIADLRAQLALEQEHLRQAVENIAKMRAQFARQSAPEGAPVAQSTPLADLWMHEDMERDAMRAALNAPRQDLKAAHEQAVEDAIYWKRRALTAEAAAPTSASAQRASVDKPTDEQISAIYRSAFPHGPYLITPDVHKFARAVLAWGSAGSTAGAGWISVADKVPPLRDEVLVWCGYRVIGHRSDDKHDPENHNGWVIDFDNGFCSAITHWMPIPAAPSNQSPAEEA